MIAIIWLPWYAGAAFVCAIIGVVWIVGRLLDRQKRRRDAAELELVRAVERE